MTTTLKALIYIILGTFYIMLSYYIIPAIANSFIGDSGFASVVYIALIITWIFAVIALPLFTLYKVSLEGSMFSAILTFVFGIILLYFGYFMITGLITALPWSGTTGTIAETILWIGWILFILGSVIFIPIYQIIANRKENRWIGTK